MLKSFVANRPVQHHFKDDFIFIYQGWHAPVVSTIYTRRQTHHHHHSCRKPKNRHDQNMGIIVSLYSLDQSDTYPLHLFLCTICQNCMVRPFTWWTVSGILWLTCTHPNLLFVGPYNLHSLLFSGIEASLCHHPYCFPSQSQTLFGIGAGRPAFWRNCTFKPFHNLWEA